MPSPTLVLVALALAAALGRPAPPAAAPASAHVAPAAQDSAEATLLSADGDAELRLTADALVFRLTDRAQRRARREVDESTRGEDASTAALAREITATVLSATRIPFPLAAVHRARADGALVVVEFTGRERETGGRLDRDNRLRFEAASPAAARAFVARIEQRLQAR